MGDSDKHKIIILAAPSGAGKTTLIDLILGILEPDKGEISISGVNPLAAISKWPGAIGYVPQDVMISNSTIRQNVCLGYSESEILDEDVWSALEVAQLADFVRNLPNQLSTFVGDRGAKLSGGQRQRLGIARAMFTRPKLLVLDEATSSLDAQTEDNVTSTINKIREDSLVLIVAHRLATVRRADLVIYMQEGQIKAQGSFEQVRELIPNFDTQAQLMGL